MLEKCLKVTQSSFEKVHTTALVALQTAGQWV